MSNDFSSFFGNLNSLPNVTSTSALSAGALPSTTPTSYQPGYFANNFSILDNKMANQSSIKQNNLLNYQNSQSDKNFNPTKIENELTQLLAVFAAATQMSKTTNATTQILQVKEYNPTNTQNSLFNQQSLIGSNTNFTSTFQEGSTSNSLASSLTKDLSNLFASGGINLATLLQISLVIENAFKSSTPVPNTTIANALVTNVGTMAPSPLTNVTSSLQYMDSMTNSGMTDAQVAATTAAITTYLNNQSNAPISNIVTPSNYTGIAISMNDPAGFNVASLMLNEMNNKFSNNTTSFLNNLNISNAVELGGIINTDFNNNTSSGIGLLIPSMSDTIKGIAIDVTNSLSVAVIAAFNALVVGIINSLGAIVPVGSTLAPIDLLYNLNQNIKARNNIINNGGTTVQTAALNDAIIPYFPAGGFNSTSLSALEQAMSELVGQ